MSLTIADRGQTPIWGPARGQPRRTISIHMHDTIVMHTPRLAWRAIGRYTARQIDTSSERRTGTQARRRMGTPVANSIAMRTFPPVNARTPRRACRQARTAICGPMDRHREAHTESAVAHHICSQIGPRARCTVARHISGPCRVLMRDRARIPVSARVGNAIPNHAWLPARVSMSTAAR